MQPADLHMTTQIVGYCRFLFVSLAQSRADAGLTAGIDDLGTNMENMHDAEGSPSEADFRRGRFQLLRAEPEFCQGRDLPHAALLTATSGAFAPGPCRCSSRATSSLPVPL